MSEALLKNLQEKRHAFAAAEAQVLDALHDERDKIKALKEEIETRGKKRDILIMQLLELGYRPGEVAKHAGVVPSYTNYVRQRDGKE